MCVCVCIYIYIYIYMIHFAVYLKRIQLYQLHPIKKKKKKLPYVSPLKSFPQKVRARKSLFPRDSAASLPEWRTVTPGVRRQSWGSTELPQGEQGDHSPHCPPCQGLALFSPPDPPLLSAEEKEEHTRQGAPRGVLSGRAPHPGRRVPGSGVCSGLTSCA